MGTAAKFHRASRETKSIHDNNNQSVNTQHAIRLTQSRANHHHLGNNVQNILQSNHQTTKINHHPCFNDVAGISLMRFRNHRIKATGTTAPIHIRKTTIIHHRTKNITGKLATTSEQCALSYNSLTRIYVPQSSTTMKEI